MGLIVEIKCPYCGAKAEVSGICTVYTCDECEEVYAVVDNTEDSFYPYDRI